LFFIRNGKLLQNKVYHHFALRLKRISGAKQERRAVAVAVAAVHNSLQA
jgi:hypothetical protein